MAAGEYLLAVNGRELAGTENLYRWFEATADRQIVVKVGPNSGASGAREVTVMSERWRGGLILPNPDPHEMSRTSAGDW